MVSELPCPTSAYHVRVTTFPVHLLLPDKNLRLAKKELTDDTTSAVSS